MMGEICRTQEPPRLEVTPDHTIYCHIPLEVLEQVEPVLNTRARQ
jgi:hypothetical protein